jgi:hypothetical protein
MRRMLPLLVGILMALWAGPGTASAGDPQGAPATQALESLSPEDQVRARENLDRWGQLTPEEQQRVRENYERWKQLSPAGAGEPRDLPQAAPGRSAAHPGEFPTLAAVEPRGAIEVARAAGSLE